MIWLLLSKDGFMSFWLFCSWVLWIGSACIILYYSGRSIVGSALKFRLKKNMRALDILDKNKFETRGKSKDHKRMYKCFHKMSKKSDTEIDNYLAQRLKEIRPTIHNRALEVHGMDSDEVKEIAPIQIEGFNSDSRFMKLSTEGVYRASEYEISYLLFSDKQMYAYNQIFDLVSNSTTEQTKEYFYHDITNVEVIDDKIDLLNPRDKIYAGRATIAFVIGFFTSMLANNDFYLFIGALFLAIGTVLACLLGFVWSITNTLTLKLTVPNDEFECAMKIENMKAIQGMKAKIREKKM